MVDFNWGKLYENVQNTQQVGENTLADIKMTTFLWQKASKKNIGYKAKLLILSIDKLLPKLGGSSFNYQLSSKDIYINWLAMKDLDLFR